MKKKRTIIACALMVLLAFSTVSVSGSTTETAKSVKNSRIKVTLTAMNSTTIKLKWPKQKKYTNCEVYRKTTAGKSYKKIASVKGTTYTDKKVKKNTLYKYKVRPFRYVKGKKTYARYSDENTAAAGVTISNYTMELTLPSDKVISVGIDAGTEDCSTNKKTMIVYRSDSENGTYKKIKEVPFKESWQMWSSTYGTHFVDKAVSGNTVYYYKVKIRKTINKKNYYSQASAPQAIRTMPKWTMNTLTYTNLTDDKTRQDVSAVFKKAGIKESYIDEVMDLAKDYNDIVGEQDYFHEGFVTVDGRNIDYEMSDTYSLWMEDHDYADVNCRITAMTLFRDFLTTETKMEGSTALSSDTDAIENYPLCKLAGEDLSKFYTLYNPVSVKDTTNPQDILEAVQQEWKNRGIQFKEGAASLISVVFHDEMDKTAFVGHAGVMIEDGSDVYFVEKIGPTFPVQVAKFHSRGEVKEYLLDRFWKHYTPGVSAPPVIMENDNELALADVSVGE